MPPTRLQYCPVCRKPLSGKTAIRMHMLAYYLHHALTAEKFTKEVEERVPLGQLIPAQPQLQPQPEPEPEVMLAPEPEPLPQPQPLQIILLWIYFV